MVALVQSPLARSALDWIIERGRFAWGIVCALLPLIGCAQPPARPFTVVAYNVENLFDVDGVALYQDYTQDEPEDPFTYSRRKLLTKLQNHAQVLQQVGAGVGPEVILFEELEADFTPASTVENFDQFLSRHADVSVADMLGDDWTAEYAGLPSAAWLLKAMADVGLTGYSVVTVPAKAMDAGIAHTNAVFSKFPIVSVQAHALERARDILEVELDVAGHSLWVYVNHWKSGASNPAREPIRRQNAAVLRGLLDARLAEDPHADIILGGDFNSHYNHSLLNPTIETGINDVLGSQGNELAIRDVAGPDLYNLWFELPPEARYSEVWRGRRGTLMHLLVTRGLYDTAGVRYIDGSFKTLQVSGLNADELGRPVAWSFAGTTGGGSSDHFPVMAQFTVESGTAGEYVDLIEPSMGDDALDFEMPLGYRSEPLAQFNEGAFLGGVSDAELGPYVGRLYQIEAQLLKLRPLQLQVGAHVWGAYAPGRALQAELAQLDSAKKHRLVVELGIWKGARQFVIVGVAR